MSQTGHLQTRPIKGMCAYPRKRTIRNLIYAYKL
jgi:hypothetical protein